MICPHRQITTCGDFFIAKISQRLCYLFRVLSREGKNQIAMFYVDASIKYFLRHKRLWLIKYNIE